MDKRLQLELGKEWDAEQDATIYYSPVALVNFQNKYFNQSINSYFVKLLPRIRSVFNKIVKPAEWCSGRGCGPGDVAQLLQKVRNIPFTCYLDHIIDKPFNQSIFVLSTHF